MAHHSTQGRCRAAFTLVELLTVLAIIMLLAGLMVALRPGNPEGLDAARRGAIAVFESAQARAMQARNPDREPNQNPLYNVRSRVLILNDPSNPEQHLRLLRVIIGGTRSMDATATSDYRWYTTDPDSFLPPGAYMVSPNDSSLGDNRRSRITNKDTSSNTMRLNFEPSLLAQNEGSGDKEWYFYEFNSDGTSNMNYATFMISEGEWDPGAKKVLFRNQQNVTGFWITPTGRTVPYTDSDEMDKQP